MYLWSIKIPDTEDTNYLDRSSVNKLPSFYSRRVTTLNLTVLPNDGDSLCPLLT